MFTRRPRLLLIGIAIALMGCTLGTAVYLARSLKESDEDWQATALIKWGNPPVPTHQWIVSTATYDFVGLSWGVWANPGMKAAADSIRMRNLDIHLGTYFNLHTVPNWCRRDAERGGTGWPARLWTDLSPFIVLTAEGDTAAIWKDEPVFNVLDPRARAAAAKVLGDYARATGVSWAMLDFVSVPLESFRLPGYPVREPDFDGNGLACRDDPAERAALRLAWGAYMTELRAAVPPGFLLIPNGGLALTDQTFSLLTDGCYVEGFGKWFYGSGDSPDYSAALSPLYGPQSVPNLCRPGRWANGVGYVMLEDYADQGLLGCVAALWPGAVELKRYSDDLTPPRQPVDLMWLGQPTGPVVMGSPLRRQFQNGSIEVTPAGPRLNAVALKTVMPPAPPVTR